MKRILILLCLPMIGFGQLTPIPDANFEQALINLGYDNGTINGSVYTAMINTVTSLYVVSDSISDLTGIEDFTALQTLYCENNQLTSLDVSNNTALTALHCGHNQLTSLDISNNIALTELECFYNQLTSLDVSQNTALDTLDCIANQLTSLDVSNNTALIRLRCGGNQLISLDVSNNTALTSLGCNSTQLTSLDLSNNTALTTLNCNSNQLTSLDLSNNTALTTLWCFSNQLTTLDVSANIALTRLFCDNNQLTTLDVSNNAALIGLDCSYNKLITLDVRNGNNTNMASWSSLDFTNNPFLYCINVDDWQWSFFNWLNSTDAQQYFANNCPPVVPVLGCTDATACNYNANANVDDGSCVYASTSSENVISCDSLVWNGATYTSGGTYTWTGVNAAGCDSTVTLDLTINNSTSNSTTATACDEYTWLVNGTTYTTNGTYTDVSINAAGCTHTETLNLTINNSSLSSTLTTACDTYTWNGMIYDTSGAYTNTYTNEAGCDSVATLHLTIHNSSTSSEDVISCDSLVWNGTTYTTSGTYTWAGVNAVGCDSIATLNFTGGVTSTITQDEDSLYSSVYPSGVDYSAQWLNIDTETGETWLMGEENNFGPRFDCNYILVITTEDGCIDTTDVYFFAEFAGQIYDLKVSPNPTRGLINIKYVNERNQFVRIYFANNNGVVLEEFISSENEMNIDISNYPSGIYYVYFSSEEHCSSAEQQISRKIILNK